MKDPTKDIIEETEVVEDFDFSRDFKMLGLRIAYFSKEKGWTQEELAHRMNMSTITSGAIEAPNMNKKISLTTLFKFSRILNVSPSRLLDFD